MKKNIFLKSILILVVCFANVHCMDKKEDSSSSGSTKLQPSSYKIDYSPAIRLLGFTLEESRGFFVHFYNNQGKIIQTYHYSRGENDVQQITVHEKTKTTTFKFNSLSALKAHKDFPLDLKNIDENNDDKFKQAKAEKDNDSPCVVQ